MKYIVLLLLILASCRSAKVEETKTLSIDSAYWRTSLTHLMRADLQDKLQMTVVVEKMQPDTTGNLRVTESSKYAIKAERDVDYNEVRGDSAEHKEKSTHNSEDITNTNDKRIDKPPNVDFILVGSIAIIIIYLRRK